MINNFKKTNNIVFYLTDYNDKTVDEERTIEWQVQQESEEN